ncbi:hypothetical protein HHL22_14975 [Hymenobacter sp. RP-2-7]|uniref:Uncharacterized protein n=1 Tax=Hymenobacter polaris TaxID=2682546 RepID=A0A7Y0FNH8_9BACT|nr:hypothetical protein [Hymenobacter polaris]NML66510.1 hypothetical protein [Hymenobacter polaris]
MRTFLLAFAAALALGACQSSSSSKTKVPANLPPEENAAPRADTTSGK